MERYEKQGGEETVRAWALECEQEEIERFSRFPKFPAKVITVETGQPEEIIVDEAQ